MRIIQNTGEKRSSFLLGINTDIHCIGFQESHEITTESDLVKKKNTTKMITIYRQTKANSNSYYKHILKLQNHNHYHNRIKD